MNTQTIIYSQTSRLHNLASESYIIEVTAFPSLPSHGSDPLEADRKSIHALTHPLTVNFGIRWNQLIIAPIGT